MSPHETLPFYQKFKQDLHEYFKNMEIPERVNSASHPPKADILRKTDEVLLANLDQEGFGCESLGKLLALSRTQLYRRLKPVMGMTPARYIRQMRLLKASELMVEGDLTIGEIAFKTGFVSPSHFTRCFRKQFGCNPSDFMHSR